MNVQAAQAAFPVSQAMAWFGGHKAALATKLKINAEASVLSMLADFTPVWDSARTAVDTNYYVVEAPAKYVKKIGYNTDSANTDINGSTRLLVLKNKRSGNLGAVLMHIHNSTGANSEQVHYMAIPQSFSGNIFYTSLQGAFINGYIYKNGKSILKSSGRAIGAKPAGPQILVAVPTDDDCYDITTNWYSQTCYYTATDELRYCDDWRYSFTTVITYCPDPGTGGGGSGGTVAPPAQCPQDTGDDGGNGGDPVTVEAIRGKLIINVAVPGDGDLPGDGGVPPDDPPSNGNYPPPSGYGSTQDSPCTPKVIDSCAQAKKLATIQTFINKMNSMKQHIDDNTEMGYMFNDPSDANSYSLIQGEPNTMNIILSVTNKIGGFMHMLPDGAVDRDGNPVPVSSTPTSDDFATMYKIYADGNMIDPSTFIMGTLTAYQTAYTIQITDVDTFAKWGKTNLLSPNDHTYSLFQQAINTSYNHYYNDLFMDKEISQQLALLDNLATSGLTLSKGNYNSMNNWTPQVSINGKIILINCNH